MKIVSLSRSPWISPFHTTKTIHSKPPRFLSTNTKPISFKSHGISSFAVSGTSDEASEPEPNSSENPEITEETKPDRVKLAFERAREYKNSLKLGGTQENGGDSVAESAKIVGIPESDKNPIGGSVETVSESGGVVYVDKNPIGESVETVSESGGLVYVDDEGGSKELPEYQENKGTGSSGRSNGKNENLPGNGDGGKVEIPEAVRIAMEKAREYKKNKGLAGSGTSNVDSEVSRSTSEEQEDKDGGSEVPEAVRIALKKAEEYKKNKGKMTNDGSNEGDVGGGKEEVSETHKTAMENAKEYDKNKRTVYDNNSSLESSKLSRLGGSAGSLDNEGSERTIGKKEELKISSIDFVGLDFADKKKSRGLPAGLVPLADPFPEGDLPEVEILVGDSSKFGNATPSETKPFPEEESADLYKPKVTTWGMFPRPSNISKTFGGGRNICPGEALETPEDRAAKEAHTKQLLVAYKQKVGLNMDPKLKAQCEKALEDGDSLMDVGRLKEALPYYQKIMDKLAFQTELHGLAALQWSICQDSLSRPEQARAMYEKLQSHPNAQVSKKAKQFMFSFQAMEMMRVKRSIVSPRNTGYQKYFEAFVDDREGYTSAGNEAEDGTLIQALPYIVFLASPILLVLLIAGTKGI